MICAVLAGLPCSASQCTLVPRHCPTRRSLHTSSPGSIQRASRAALGCPCMTCLRALPFCSQGLPILQPFDPTEEEGWTSHPWVLSPAVPLTGQATKEVPIRRPICHLNKNGTDCLYEPPVTRSTCSVPFPHPCHLSSPSFPISPVSTGTLLVPHRWQSFWASLAYGGP